MSDDATTPDRRDTHIRSFVLRQGRVSEAQRRFHEQGMPRWGIPYRAAPLDLDAEFGRHAPHVLEIGCGMGETTACSRRSPPANLPTCG